MNFNNNVTIKENKLLCTFSKISKLDKALNEILNNYRYIKDNKILVLRSKEIMEEFNFPIYFIYNIYNEFYVTDKVKNTILIHRKKNTNTLYTINSINKLIWLLNDGIEDHSYIIDWNNYRNTLLLTEDDELVKINTKLLKIIKL